MITKQTMSIIHQQKWPSLISICQTTWGSLISDRTLTLVPLPTKGAKSLLSRKFEFSTYDIKQFIKKSKLAPFVWQLSGTNVKIPSEIKPPSGRLYFVDLRNWGQASVRHLPCSGIPATYKFWIWNTFLVNISISIWIIFIYCFAEIDSKGLSTCVYPLCSKSDQFDSRS